MRPQKIWSIYLITCSVNGKKYVGQTIKDPEIRWLGHINDARSLFNKRPFIKAIRRYGKKKFSVSLVATAPTQLLADSLERQAIKILNTQETGYNVTAGGFGVGPLTSSHKQSISLSLFEYYKTHRSPTLGMRRRKSTRKLISKAAQQLANDPEWIQKVSEATRKAFQRPEIKERHLASLPNGTVPVEQAAKLYQQTKSIYEVAEILGFSPGGIFKALRRSGLVPFRYRPPKEEEAERAREARVILDRLLPEPEGGWPWLH
jgi:group I intron endonuclease